jgi:hypothetical protein
MGRRFFGAAYLLASATVIVCTSDAVALEPAPLFVNLASIGKVRVQIADGDITPCDSADNHMVYSGWMQPNETIATAIGHDCACIRHTTPRFPNTEWSASTKYCRPRVCRGRICRPAADPTIRVQLTAF